MPISIRPAVLSDTPKLAEYFLISSQGGVEWLCRDALPNQPVNVIVEHLFTRIGSAMDFTNCWTPSLSFPAVSNQTTKTALSAGRASASSRKRTLLGAELEQNGSNRPRRWSSLYQ